ncbi:MAG TPA: hypothetical protein VIV11_16475 [Kofleriaceae bacterium]
MKLFAVAVLAGASNAHADTATQAMRAQADEVDPNGYVDWSGKIEIMAIKPRRLANGSPAAGNIDGKQPGPSVIETTQTALAAASLAYQAANTPIVIKPRLLGNNRPACGNTGGKADPPDDCTAAETAAVEAAWRDERQAYEREEAKRAPKLRAAYTRLMSATEAALRANPSLKTRIYMNGRPACGNTMSKKGPEAFCRAADAK